MKKYTPAIAKKFMLIAIAAEEILGSRNNRTCSDTRRRARPTYCDQRSSAAFACPVSATTYRYGTRSYRYADILAR
jgi:hypothetical protein